MNRQKNLILPSLPALQILQILFFFSLPLCILSSMKKILFVKLTSLGDLIHALPALTDAKNAYPDLEVDWVIDENFQEVALWHPAVRRAFPTNHRKWRKNLFASVRPICNLAKSIRKSDY